MYVIINVRFVKTFRYKTDLALLLCFYYGMCIFKPIDGAVNYLSTMLNGQDGASHLTYPTTHQSLIKCPTSWHSS